MQRVKLEQVVKASQFYGALHVIDYRVAVHEILGVGRELPHDISEELLAKWIAKSWQCKLLAGPSCLPLFPHATVIVDDSKLDGAYWRTLLYDKYKFRDYSAKVVLPDVAGAKPRCSISYGQVRDIGYVVAEQLGLSLFSEPLYEADDWAGSVHRLAKAGKLNRHVLYSTIDSDWMQLVDDESRQWWCQSSNWGETRLRNEAEIRYYAWHRQGVRIKHPSEIAQVKQQRGDTADNLPAGAPLELFDLCSEHSKYKVPRQDELLAACLSKPRDNTHKVADAWQWCKDRDLPTV